MVHKKKIPAQRLALSVALAVLAAFALCFMPRTVHAEAPADLTAGVRSDEEIDELVDRLLSAGDYAQGAPIVCYLPSDGDELTAQASDLLAGAEHLSEVTSRQFAEATGEALPAADEGALTAQSADKPVEIAFVQSAGTTEELLRELLRDPQVLSAEPNYYAYLAEESLSDETAEEPPAVVAGEVDQDYLAFWRGWFRGSYRSHP